MTRINLGLAVLVLALLAVPALSRAQQASGDVPPAKGAPAVAVVNLNTATVAQLDTLPGIGAKVAARIVEYRQKNGAFKKIEELMNVKGIGEKNFLRLKPYITVTPAKAAPSSH